MLRRISGGRVKPVEVPPLIDLSQYFDGTAEVENSIVKCADEGMLELLGTNIARRSLHDISSGWSKQHKFLQLFNEGKGGMVRCITASGESIDWHTHRSNKNPNAVLVLARRDNSAPSGSGPGSGATSPSPVVTPGTTKRILRPLLEKMEKQEKDHNIEQEHLRHRLQELKMVHQVEMLENTINTRREFLAYIFHEIRVPFQVVKLGVNELVMNMMDLVNKSIPLAQEAMAPTVWSSKMRIDSQIIMSEVTEAQSAFDNIIASQNALRKDDVFFGEMMQKMFVDAPDVTSSVQEATVRIERILNDVMMFHNIEAGEFNIIPNPFSIPKLMEVAKNNATTAMKKQNLLFTASVDPKIIALEAEQSQLMVGDFDCLLQVLNNFLSNASKFTKSGSVDIEAKLIQVDLAPPSPNTQRPARAVLSSSQMTTEKLTSPPEDADNLQSRIATIQISVSDTGSGIPEERWHSIFQPYIHIRVGESQSGGGTGLGLSISKEYAKRHGGNIAVASRTDGLPGSVFTLSLALKMVTTKETCTRIRGSSLDLSSCTADILIVEDSLLNQKMIGRLLKRYGLTFEVSNNGADAVQRVVKNGERYQMILMDKEMPVMDGHDATRTIRTVDTSVPIVGVTGNTLEHQRAEFMSCGADAVLAKPLSRREFENVVLRLLRLEISIS